MSDEPKVVRTAAKLCAGYHQVEIMLHALGFQKRAGRWSSGGWRNHFDAGDSDDAGVCAGLAAEGWMCKLSSGCFSVTKAGKSALQLAGWNFGEGGI